MRVNDLLFYTAGASPALTTAATLLERRGCNVTTVPGDQVTHLLLPVPSFERDGTIKGGGDITQILSTLPANITIIGGNLRQDTAAAYKTIDLLRDELYLAENAAITAHCAIREALCRLPATLQNCQVLVIGWGRIGKCLAELLKAMGASVTVAARKETDRAMLRALGYGAVDPGTLGHALMRFRVIFNTVPLLILGPEQLRHCRKDCLKIDLASQPGIAGEDVIWARGLPGKDAPETSGDLIARAVIRLTAKKE